MIPINKKHLIKIEPVDEEEENETLEKMRRERQKKRRRSLQEGTRDFEIEKRQIQKETNTTVVEGKRHSTMNTLAGQGDARGDARGTPEADARGDTRGEFVVRTWRKKEFSSVQCVSVDLDEEDDSKD